MSRLFKPRAFLCTVILAGLIFAAPVFSQTAPAVSQSFSSSAELVLVPVIVEGKAGHVPGLKKEDFVLKEDGKSQSIDVFEEIKTDPARQRRSQGEGGTFSNFDPGSGGYHRLSIIVLDYVNTPQLDQLVGRAALIKFLLDVAESGEPIGLLALTRGGLIVLHDFTRDPRILAAALRQGAAAAPSLTHEPQVDASHPTGGDGLAEALTRMIRGQLEAEAFMNSLENKTRALLTVNALQQIARAFGGLPGRKSLIWASSGFEFSLSPVRLCEPACPAHTREEVQDQYEKVWRLMNDSQIAIYSVDLRSVSNGIFMTPEGVRPSDRHDAMFDTDARFRETMHATSDSLQLFAGNTGGKAFLGGGNLIESFRQAIQDDSQYYMLGYYINRSRTRPGWHKLAVNVQAKGVRLRHRAGFLLARDSSPNIVHQDIQLALNSPLDFTGIPVSLTWTGRQAESVPGKTTVSFDLIMPAGFAFVDASDQNHMLVDVAVAARNATGELVADISQRIDVHLKSPGLEQIRDNGLTYRNKLRLPPGDYNVHCVVRDSLGERMGSVTAPLTVRP